MVKSAIPFCPEWPGAVVALIPECCDEGSNNPFLLPRMQRVSPLMHFRYR